MNKKGGEKLISLWWFLIIILVAGGIVIGVAMYYGASVDVRAAEANLLMLKTRDCLSENGFLPDNILRNDFDLMEYCKLNNESFGINSPFYLRISFFDEKKNKLRVDIQIGNVPYEKDCSVAKTIDAKKYPKCVYENVNVNYYLNEIKNARLEILAASNQIGMGVLN